MGQEDDAADNNNKIIIITDYAVVKLELISIWFPLICVLKV